MVIDVASESDISAIVEPFYLGFDATVEMYPVMAPDNLDKSAAKAAGTDF